MPCLESRYAVGTEVEAIYEDGSYYPAAITKVLPRGAYEIVYSTRDTARRGVWMPAVYVSPHRQKRSDIHTHPHGFVAKYTILIFLTLVLSKDTYCIIIQYTVCQLLFIVNFRMYNVMSMSKGKEILLKHTMQLVCWAYARQTKVSVDCHARSQFKQLRNDRPQASARLLKVGKGIRLQKIHLHTCAKSKKAVARFLHASLQTGTATVSSRPPRYRVCEK